MSIKPEIENVEILKLKKKIYLLADELGKRCEAKIIIDSIINKYADLIKVGYQLSFESGSYTTHQLILINLSAYRTDLYMQLKRKKTAQKIIKGANHLNSPFKYKSM